MSLASIAEAAAVRLLGKLALYVVFGLFGTICALFALYNFTIAGMTALETEFGGVTARLIIAGIYMMLTLASAGMLWFWASKAGKFEPTPEPAPRHVQLAALIEALILGYETAKKGRRTR
jgi:hypothetical protein